MNHDLFDARGRRIRRTSPHRDARGVRRLVAILELLQQDDPPSRAAATWEVLSSPSLGQPRFIAMAEQGGRLVDRTLEQKFWALLRRHLPTLEEYAHDEVRSRLLAGLPDAATRLAKNAAGVSGGVKGAAQAQAETKAAEVLMRATGLLDRKAANVQATQVNVHVTESHAQTIAAADAAAAEVLEGEDE